MRVVQLRARACSSLQARRRFRVTATTLLFVVLRGRRHGDVVSTIGLRSMRWRQSGRLGLSTHGAPQPLAANCSKDDMHISGSTSSA